MWMADLSLLDEQVQMLSWSLKKPITKNDSQNFY